MKRDDSASRKTNKITIGQLTFKTSGNIIFEEEENGSYFLAESNVLKKPDNFIENGIQMLIRSSRG
jgi:hypothetical protein